MGQSDATPTSSSTSPTPLQPIAFAGCLGYGLLVGLVFGIVSGLTLAVRRIPDFPDDIIDRCFVRGFFGGAELGMLFGLVVGGLIGALGRRSQQFQTSGVTAGGTIGLVAGGVVAAFLLMEVSTLKTGWREQVPYADSISTTIAVYSLMSVVGALTGALFGYMVASVVRHRQLFRRHLLLGIALIAASSVLCGLCVLLAVFLLSYLEPIITHCHQVL